MNNTNKFYGFRCIGATERINNNTFVTGQNNHDIIIGPSGSGKTGGYVVPNLQNPFESLIVVDTKGSLCKKFRDSLIKKGFKVDVLHFVNPEKSTCGFNPLSYLKMNKDGNVSQKDVKSLAATLVPILDKRDLYWSLSARKYVAMLIAYVMEMLPEENQNMRSIFSLHMETCAKRTKEHFDELCDDEPNSMFACLYKALSNIYQSDKTWACVLDFASAALDSLDTKEMDEIWINKESYDFTLLGKEKSVLFVNISDMDRTFDAVLNLIYVQGLNSLVELADSNGDGRLNVPVRFIMDDFTSGAPIEHFDNIISVIRSRDISVSLIIQSLSQLNAKYGYDNAKTILNNCDHILYLGSNDIDTLRYISTRLNVAEHIIERLPKEKAYLFSSGKGGRLIDKMKPYSTLENDTLLNTKNNDNTRR